MVKIVFNNNQACFVQLWRWLERTRQFLRLHNKRFCIRRVLQAWFGIRATEDFIWEVCNPRHRGGQAGHQLLPREPSRTGRCLLRGLPTEHTPEREQEETS